jgi:hypothetical protein
MTDLSVLSNLLKYDRDTGRFTWKVARTNKIKVGDEAGCLIGGYRIINVGYIDYRAHQLAWLFSYGEWPSKDIDHINGVRDDNRIANLRLATPTENARNQRKGKRNTSGFKGVSFCKKTQKWSAHIQANGKSRRLGRFETPEEAHAAYCTAAKEFFGEFACTT